MIDRTPTPRDQRAPLPAFDPVPRRKPRHDGWTPARQVAFIEALADTGSVTHAAAQVNMSSESAYCLRRQPGAEGFARAWEAALDMGVLRLKDEAFDRAMNGQLVPVIAGGKLLGYRRVRNDRLIMFVLRHYGQRPQTGSFRPARRRNAAPAIEAEAGPKPSPARRPRRGRDETIATPDPAHAILTAFAGIDLDEEAQAQIIAVLTASAARARALMPDHKRADDPTVPFVRERNMPFDHPDTVTPFAGPTSFEIGDPDVSDQCWRLLDLPDPRLEQEEPATAIGTDTTALPALASPERTVTFPAPLPGDQPDHAQRLARFSEFLASGRPLDEWTEWRG